MNVALILAAGKGNRYPNKLFREASGHPILFFPLMAFEKHGLISRIVVIARKKDQKAIRTMVMEAGCTKISAMIEGGKSRQESMEKGFRYYEKHIRGQKKENKDIIIVHNGANPLVSEREITNVIRAAKKYGAAACAQPVIDTIREVKDGFSAHILKRENLVAMQTPQAIRADWLSEGLKMAKKDDFLGTDDVSLVERIGKKVRMVAASSENKKMTYPDDLKYVKYILEKRWSGALPHCLPCAFSDGFIRIGIGEDSHVFSKENGLTMGGVRFSHYKKLQANSDGDVILHALFNAISSAMGEGSIGQTADAMLQKKGTRDSKKYIENLLKKLEKKGLKVSQISLSIEAKIPQIDPIEESLKQSLSKILSLPADRIGITATSGEGLTPFGRGKAVRCCAIVMLRESRPSTDSVVSMLKIS